MRAVVVPRCCTSCCTELTIKCQGGSVRLPLATLAPPGFFGVRWRQPLMVAINLEPQIQISADFRTEWWQTGRVGVLFILCGILVGLAVYRSGEARARWQSLKSSRTTVRNQRNTAWRHAGSAALYVVGAIFLLFIVVKFFK
jgi:hypothetical protein